MTEPANSTLRIYAMALKEVCHRGAESDLPREAALLTKQLISAGDRPQGIRAMHAVAVEEVLGPNDARGLAVAQAFLLEVLVAYGVSYGALTERLLAEADAAATLARTRADDAERAEHDRLELLAGVSHELGTPLTVIKANVASIRRFLEQRESWPDELSQREDDVEFAVDRMLALREELLAASRNELRELEIGPLHLERSLQRVVRWAQSIIVDKGLSLTEEYAAKAPYILGDDWALQSIIGNLLSNAIRYTPKGGSISVRTYNEGPDLVLEVTDTGIGITGEEQLRIFERFYRAEEAKNVVPFGIGLGLAIARDLVSALGGSIDILSQHGAGSTFKVTLPAAPMVEEDA
jgi:two-component system, OmpR family, sensor kinase